MVKVISTPVATMPVGSLGDWASVLAMTRPGVPRTGVFVGVGVTVGVAVAV